jgi:hypothetical protein
LNNTFENFFRSSTALCPGVFSTAAAVPNTHYVVDYNNKQPSKQTNKQQQQQQQQQQNPQSQTSWVAYMDPSTPFFLIINQIYLNIERF